MIILEDFRGALNKITLWHLDGKTHREYEHINLCQNTQMALNKNKIHVSDMRKGETVGESENKNTFSIYMYYALQCLSNFLQHLLFRGYFSIISVRELTLGLCHVKDHTSHKWRNQDWKLILMSRYKHYWYS